MTFLWFLIGVLMILFIINIVKDIGNYGRKEEIIICPNQSGYKGKPKKVARGNILIGFILCFFFLLPGILYFIFKGGYRYHCPKCGIQIRNDV